MHHRIENKLGYLGFRLYSPSPALAPFIRNYWMISRAHLPEAAKGEFWHPDGGLGLVFNFADPMQINGERIDAQAFLDGTNSRSNRMLPGRQVNALGIRFKPAGAHYFFRVPIEALQNRNYALQDIDMPQVSRLCQQLQQAHSDSEQIGLIEDWLLHCMHVSGHGHGIPAAMQSALGHLHYSGGQHRMQALADELALSRRTLERQFRKHLGMPAKTYANLLRVDRARQLLKQGPKWRGADIGAITGYYDQAHFVREFQDVVGLTPMAYRRYKTDPALLSQG